MNEKWWEDVDWDSASVDIILPTKPLEREKTYEEKEAEFIKWEQEEAMRSMVEEQQEEIVEGLKETVVEPMVKAVNEVVGFVSTMFNEIAKSIIDAASAFEAQMQEVGKVLADDKELESLFERLNRMMKEVNELCKKFNQEEKEVRWRKRYNDTRFRKMNIYAFKNLGNSYSSVIYDQRKQTAGSYKRRRL